MKQLSIQPRSQDLSSLPPLVVGCSCNDQGRQRRETLGTRLFSIVEICVDPSGERKSSFVLGEFK